MQAYAQITFRGLLVNGKDTYTCGAMNSRRQLYSKLPLIPFLIIATTQIFQLLSALLLLTMLTISLDTSTCLSHSLKNTKTKSDSEIFPPQNSSKPPLIANQQLTTNFAKTTGLKMLRLIQTFFLKSLSLKVKLEVEDLTLGTLLHLLLLSPY